MCNDSGILLDNLYHMASVVPESAGIELKPVHLELEINQLNDFVYKNINNAVYRCVAPLPSICNGLPSRSSLVASTWDLGIH